VAAGKVPDIAFSAMAVRHWSQALQWRGWFMWRDGRWDGGYEPAVRDWAHGMLRSYKGDDYKITEKVVDELVRHARTALAEEFRDEW
jgi:hypothetical protein